MKSTRSVGRLTLTLAPLLALSFGWAACGDKQTTTERTTETMTSETQPMSPTPTMSDSTPGTQQATVPAEAHPDGDGHDEAGEEHAHGSPHGGTVKTAGAGHLELVLTNGNLMVYPLDKAEQPLPVAGITGATALVQIKGKPVETVALKPMGNGLMGAVPGGATVFTAIINVPINGQTASARFTVGADGDTDHAH